MKQSEEPTWRISWLQLLSHISDLPLQQERWLNVRDFPSPYWSFIEFHCMYFIDLGTESGYSELVASGLVSPEEADAVQKFHAAFEAYSAPRNNDRAHAEILADAKWQAVVALAKEARQRLLQLPLADAERKVLRGG